MAESVQLAAPEIRRAFAEYDREVTLQNIRIGCYLGMLLMPAGIVLDYFVYPDQLGHFFRLRLASSALIGLFLMVVMAPFGRRHYRALGVTLAMFPTFFIALMIEATNGPDSPYYAGLNLVLLVVGFVLHWTARESLAAVLLVLGMYLGACAINVAREPSFDGGIFFNNLYFLALTGIIVVTGNYFQSRLRFREFALRFELDRNQRMLQETNEKLVELDRAKSRFFANISHELRTPLTLLLGPLESLLQRDAPLDGPAARERLATMHANGLRLLKLINDLLDLVRLDSGRMQPHPEPVEIESFARGVLSAVQRMAEDKRIRLVPALEPGLGTRLLDRDKLERILLNLLFNALKFTPGGGEVRLRIAMEGAELVLAVEDTGIGIAPEHLPFVFDRFWQADTSSRRRHQGAGIGLALVKELTEIHGGRVEAQSEPGRGTRMVVRIPCATGPGVGSVAGNGAPPQPAAEGAVSAGLPSPAVAAAESVDADWLAGLYRRAELFPSMNAGSMRLPPVELPGARDVPTVLVADDEPDMLRFLRSELGRHWRVVEAVDGQQALDKASQFLPDVILLDMMMPERDGLEVCRELRQRLTTREIPVILLTARADEETKLATLSAGASDFLAKPFSTTELVVRVRNLVESNRSRQGLARQKRVLEATLEQLKETEAELVHSEKLASLGRMSAGIIHEINNPLNYVRTNLFALRRKGAALPESERADYEEILGDIQDGIDRVRNIVSDLRVFTHPKPTRSEMVEVGRLVDMACRLVSNQLRDEVRVITEVPEGLKVLASETQVIQILVNLLQNAVDALKGRPATEGPGEIRITAVEESGRVWVKVADNGPGIAPDVMPKIFDPFFTTKDVGEGMGLGLSVCYRIMVDHGGRIHVKSEPGGGAEFVLEFPAGICSS